MSSIQEIKINEWNEFISFINEYQFIKMAENDSPIGVIFDPNDNGVYYRGVSNPDYNLSSTLERYILNALNKNKQHRLSRKLFEKVSSEFINRSKAKLKAYIPEQTLLLDKKFENEIWFWGQHYGMPTPFLDWSKSFFVALYFAFEDKYKKSDHRAIYCLRDLFQKLKIYPSDIDIGGRLSAQKGVFTKMLSYEFEEFNYNYPKSEIVKNGIPLTKILISSRLRPSIMEFLLSININATTIYPDIKGAIQNCCFELNDIIEIECCS